MNYISIDQIQYNFKKKTVFFNAIQFNWLNYILINDHFNEIQMNFGNYISIQKIQWNYSHFIFNEIFINF